MKFRLFAVALWIAGLCQAASGAVTFTVSPNTVSNTFKGLITLQINGVTTGDTVVLRKYLDADTNSVVDSKDTLVQQFNLTDGQAGQVIGGVTNGNVPGDLDVTNGAITAKLNFPNGDFTQNLNGKYLYVLSSPVGHFSPITNAFTVTNFPYAQKFTGNVVSNSTATTLPNSIILLFPPPRAGHNGPGQPVGGCVANNSGGYSIMAPAGTYTLVAFRSNYLGSFQTAPVLTLGSGVTLNTNLSLLVATSSISGTLVDATNNAIKLPGIFMPVESTNHEVASVYSDTNGNFTARVNAGAWSLGSDDSGLIVHGYVGYQNGTNVNAGASGVILPFPKANVLFYGSVKDNLGNPFAGIDVNDNDTTSNLYSMDGYTDTNGNYFVGALGSGSSDPWQIGVSGESTSILTNYIISQPPADQNGGTNLTPGLAVPQDFTLILATNTISGNVKDTSNNPITNVQVFAYTTISGVSYQTQANTDNSGNYSENVANGTWSVNLSCGGGQNSLPTNYQCPNSVMVTISNNNAVTNFVVQVCNGVTITTASPLPFGETNAYYNQFLQASSCNPNFTWMQTAGSLPPGLTLFTNGVISGTPTTPGTYGFTVQVTDGNSAMTNQVFSLSISNGVQITTTSLPDGTNGVSYSHQLTAINGQPPYTWTNTSGSLPANLTLSPGGLISGTVQTTGTFDFTVQATDVMGGYAIQPLSLTLISTNVPPPLAISTASGQIFVFYPASAGTNFVLQEATNVAGPWVPATNGVPQSAFSFTNGPSPLFFRLQ